MFAFQFDKGELVLPASILEAALMYWLLQRPTFTWICNKWFFAKLLQFCNSAVLITANDLINKRVPLSETSGRILGRKKNCLCVKLCLWTGFREEPLTQWFDPQPLQPACQSVSWQDDWKLQRPYRHSHWCVSIFVTGGMWQVLRSFTELYKGKPIPRLPDNRLIISIQ